MGFTPIPEMNAPNSTVELVFVSFNGYNIAPSDDLWLSAHEERSISVFDPGYAPRNVTVYGMDNSVNVLGCTEQHQFCNPNRPMDSDSRCTPLLDWGTLGLDFDAYTSAILDTPHQVEAITIIMYAALAAEMRVSSAYLKRRLPQIKLILSRTQSRTSTHLSWPVITPPASCPALSHPTSGSSKPPTGSQQA